ncbi:MAG: trehalase family glycosidase [Mobilitalea sp.]
MERDYSFLDHLERGMYFNKKEYQDRELPLFEEVKEKLPAPYIEARPEWSDCYWYTAKVLLRNTHKPTTESGYVSNFVDAAFNKDIFLWDTCFMTLFCNLFHPYIPGIRSLDNFYCKQFEDGEIPREMVRDTGKDFLPWVNAYDKPLYSYFHNHYGFRGLGQMMNLNYEDMYKPDLGRSVEKNPYLTLDNLNHPILAMAEWQSYCHTGDIERLSLVFEPLYQYYQAFRYHVRHANGMYVTDWASMDNSPRNKFLGFGVDPTCEMVLFAGNLLDIVEELGKNNRQVAEAESRKAFLLKDRQETIDVIQKYMWNEEDGFFYDVTAEGKQSKMKTAAAFWALISGVAEESQQKHLAAWLEDPKTFNRPHRVPVLAADEQEYNPMGGYWSGSVWAPMNAMIVLGLEKCGYHKLAKDIAMNHLEVLNQVFQQTGSIWENYPPEYISKGNSDHPDMIGWSGIAPVLYLIQYGIGLSVPEGKNYLMWELPEEFLAEGCVGCDKYWFQGKEAGLRAQSTKNGISVTIKTKDSFTLLLRYQDREKRIEVDKDTVVEI